MSEPLFLTVSEALEIHAEQIDIYGGEGGVRDHALLESAVAAPQSGMGGEYFHRDLYEMAAAYLYHIVKNHPFVDGNKRAGLACAYLFLAINGYTLDCDADELADFVLKVTKNRMDKLNAAEFLRSHVIKQEP